MREARIILISEWHPKGNDTCQESSGGDQQPLEMLTKASLQFVKPGYFFFKRTAIL
jgi:hypothetical protein